MDTFAFGCMKGCFGRMIGIRSSSLTALYDTLDRGVFFSLLGLTNILSISCGSSIHISYRSFPLRLPLIFIPHEVMTFCKRTYYW